MALDIIARAAAASARSSAVQALSRTTTLDLFTNLPSRTLDGITAISTGGYNAVGRGGGVYVNDSLATAALAAAHPRFCKADAAGRYFRLAGDSITVEQGGAAAAAGINDQPAIQATINYAQAVGIGEVRFTRSGYELWCPARTSTQGPGWAGLSDGYPIYISANMALKGLEGGSLLTFLNPVGQPKTSGIQASAWGTWYGGGIWVDANPTGSTADIERVHFENLVLDGTVPCTNPYVNTGANVSDKGLSFPSNGTFGVKLLKLRNMVVRNFCGELFYGGSFKAGSSIIAENVELYNSNQSAWNPTGLGKVFATNLNAHDAYLPSEIITGQGHIYVGCRFANGSNCGVVATQFFASGYTYAFPNRDTAKAPTWVEYHGTTFENISVVNLSSWTRGSLTLIDSSLNNLNFSDRDIDLDVVHITDQKNGTGITITGPSTLTQAWSLAPAGTYIEPPRNIFLRTVWRRTAVATAAGKYSAGMVYNGLIDKATVRVTVDGEVRSAIVCGSTPTGFAIPLTIVNPAVTVYAGGGLPLGGATDTITADKSYKVLWSSLAISPTVAGPLNISLDNTYSYANGQLVTIFYGYPAGSGVLSFAATGAGMQLRETRKLRGFGDKLVLRWDTALTVWMEQEYVCVGKMLYTGSATYDAPSIAAGASATTTVTCTGAQLGDFVEHISLGVSSAGLTVTGYVSAANTVTVVLANQTGAPVDLASTTLNVEVRRKI